VDCGKCVCVPVFAEMACDVGWGWVHRRLRVSLRGHLGNISAIRRDSLELGSPADKRCGVRGLFRGARGWRATHFLVGHRKLAGEAANGSNRAVHRAGYVYLSIDLGERSGVTSTDLSLPTPRCRPAFRPWWNWSFGSGRQDIKAAPCRTARGRRCLTPSTLPMADPSPSPATPSRPAAASRRTGRGPAGRV